jgi:predicted nucleotidyltransferase
MGYKAKGQRVIVEEVPVDMFPVSIHPIYEEALQKAIRAKVDGITVKIFSPEYLIVTKLMVFRERDRGDISDLFRFAKVNMNLLKSIIKRYDDEKSSLHKRLQEILGRSGKAR